MIRKILFAFSLLFIAHQGFAQLGSLNVSLLSHRPYTMNLNDVWGYVDTVGTEYALVGTVDGVSIVSLANPANPVELFYLPGINSTWRDLKTWDHYAYVTNESGDGLRIIDLGGLPGTINYKDTIIGGATTAHNIWIDEFGYAYIIGNGVNYGFQVLDLNNNPWYPELTGPGYGLNYVHDAYVRNNLAYAAEIYTGNLTVIDVSDKNNITVLGTTTYANAFTHNTWLDSSGTVCFTTDELNNAYIHAFDVSNPSNIVMLDRIRSSQSNGAATPHNTHYINGFLATSYYEDGLQIVDAHRPNNLVEVGFLDTQSFQNVGTLGAWGAYPYLPSGICLITDMISGFYVVAPNYTRASYLEGTAYQSGTSTTLSNVTVYLDNSSISELTDNVGEYRGGGLADTIYQAHAYKFGYMPADTSLSLAPGQVTIWNPIMVPSPVVGLTVRVEDANSGLAIPNAQVEAFTLGARFDYVANANGEITDPNFLQGQYTIIAGKWGYVTNGLTLPIDSATGVVTIQLQAGYYDDFTFDFGWTVSGPATGGQWERGIPQGTPFYSVFLNPNEDASGDWGGSAFVTGNNGIDVDDDDIDGGATVLTSPVMDLSGMNYPWMVFDYWFITTSVNGQPGFKDSLAIYIDNGTQRELVWHIRDLLQPAWVTDTIKISHHLPLTNNMRVIVRASDNLFAQFVEAGFDHFYIADQSTVGTVLPKPAADLLQAWPNPSHDVLNFRYQLIDKEEAAIRIVDAMGRQISYQKLDAMEGSFQLQQHLPSGIYFASLERRGQVVAMQKIIRNK